MTHALYLYYKVAGFDADLHRRLLALQQELGARCGVTARLLRRRDDPSTWMEVYEGIVDDTAFAAALVEAEQRHGISALVGARHAEWFQPFDGVDGTLERS
ncbi:DUF4936 family protein [Pseudogulbenkiania sp. MAI-1]|uniref:DUF4936 family protein n=1 Tax=Pseudogulbenkiania sp. MAI-1 TaxID=990370 RepID=UPI00045E81CB|nr:DUF4936 family protein [Pseudogulbenkiania sp. MAI-1]